MTQKKTAPVPRRDFSLWLLTIGPGIWALHFLACYITGAVYCAKLGGDLTLVRWTVGAYTVFALAGIGWAIWFGIHRYFIMRRRDEIEDAFIGLSMATLAGLSLIATLYVAIVALFFDSCR